MKSNKQKSKNLKLEQEQFIEIEENKKNYFIELLNKNQTAINEIILNFLKSNNNGQQLIQIKKIESLTKLFKEKKQILKEEEIESIKILIELVYYIQFNIGSKNASANKSMSQIINSVLLIENNVDNSSNEEIKELINKNTVESINKLFIKNDQLNEYSIFGINFLIDQVNLTIPEQDINIFKFISIIQDKLSKYCSTLELSSNTDTLTLYDCEHTLRGLVTLFNRFSNLIRTNLLDNIKLVDNDQDNLVYNSMQLLVKQLERILSNSTFPRQLGTNAGYLISEIIILYSNDTESSQKQILSSLTNNIDENISILNILNLNNSFYNKFINFPEINQISILRGLCLTGNLYLSLTKPIFNNINTVDQHNRFISLEYIYLCLIKIKEWLEINEKLNIKKEELISSIFPNLKNYEEFFNKFFNKTLELVWKNWESTINNISTLSTEIFDLLLIIHFKCCDIDESINYQDDHQQIQSNSKSFIKNITIKLIDEDWYQKNKYILLKYILERVGSIFMINLRGNFLKNIFSSMIDHTICNSVKVFLELFIENLKLNYNSLKNQEKEVKLLNNNELNQIEKYWILPLLEVLTETDSVTSSRIILYALPVLLKVFPESLFKILDILINNDGSTSTETSTTKTINLNIRLRISLALLNSSRQLSLIDGRKLQLKYYGLIEKSLENQDESLRLLGLELVCVSPKQTERVTIRELKLIKNFILLNLKGSSPFIRNQSLATLHRFWLRLRESCCKVFRAKTNTNISIERDDPSIDPTSDDRYMTIEDLIEYINWSCQLFTFNIYPDAPFPRKMLPLEAFNQFIDIWSSKCNSTTSGLSTDKKLSIIEFLKYIEEKSTLLYSKESTEILVNNLWDNYDRCREVSTEILLKFPSPLPGMESEDKIAPFLLWAIKLSCSPKARECDTGAYALKLYLKKYVLSNGLVPVFHSNQQNPVTFKVVQDKNQAVFEFIQQILRILKSQIKIANKSLLEASKFAPMHGLILSLNYILSEISFQEIYKNNIQKHQWKLLITEIIELMKLISNIVLRVVADLAPEGNNPNNLPSSPSSSSSSNDNLPNSLPSGVIYDDDERLANNFSSSISLINDSNNLFENINQDDEDNDEEMEEEEEEEISENLNKSEKNLKGGIGQIITVCSWQCTKQISLLLGIVLDKIEIPSKESNDNENIITTKQIEDIGDQFFTILLQSRHKGAIEKTYLGFQVLCSTLMKSNNPSLNYLPSKWIEFLFKRVKEQSLQITRRSAGLPFAFIGILTGESTSNQRVNKLLNQVMENLLNLANNNDNINNHSQEESIEINVEKNIYLPQVHSINILKSIFRSKLIIQELDQYLSRTLITVIKAFSSKSWSVRNSATMAFSVLVDRIIGTKKLKADNSIINTTTFYHFFSRMPAVYSFLLDYFKNSLKFIKESNLVEEGKIVQSSIYAILVLFSRLQPSNIDHPNDPLAPAAFVPLISQCCQFSNYMVRQISARALVPLISTIELIPFLKQLIHNLIKEQQEQVNNEFNNNKIHGVLLQVYYLIKGHLPTINLKEREVIISIILNDYLPKIKSIIKSNLLLPLEFIYYSILVELQKNSLNLCENFQDIIKPIYNTIIESLLNNDDQEKLKLLPMYYNWVQVLLEFVLNEIKRKSNLSNLSSIEKDEINEILFKLFNNQLYEIQIFTIQFLLKNQKIINEILNQKQLQLEIFKIILNEKLNINLKKKSFKILSLLSSLPIINNDDINFYELLNNLIWNKSNLIKKESIIIFGYYLKQFYQIKFSNSSSTSSTIIELNKNDEVILNNWIKILKEFSNINQPVEFRNSILESIKACSLFIFKNYNSNNNQLLSKIKIETLLSLILLLEDDDEIIRFKASVLSSKILNLIKNPSIIIGDDDIKDSEIIIIENSKCLEEIFSILSSFEENQNLFILSRFIEILNLDKKNIFNQDQDYQNQKVLFDKEKDNYFEEQLLRIQLINQQFYKFNNNDLSTKKFFLDLELKLVDSILLCTNWLKNNFKLNSSNPLNHWLTFNQEIFINFYTLISVLNSIFKINNNSNQINYKEFIDKINLNLLNIQIHPVLKMVLNNLIDNLINNYFNLPVNYYFLTSKQ